MCVEQFTWAMRLALRLAVAIGLMCTQVGNAQVTKCVDKAGNVQFSNLGCASNSSGKVVDSRPNSLDTSGMREQNRSYLETRQREVAERQAAMQPQTDSSDVPGDDRNFRACVSEVEDTKGISQRQKASLLLRCQSLAQSSAGKTPSKIDDCISRINALRGLSERQRASSLVACRGGGMPTAADGMPGPPGASPKPTVITSCDRGGCWDNLGGRYNGSGPTLVTSTGKVCQRAGNVLICPP
jgi:hypothetical protein